jgi:hydroxymethylpyrimidine kinase/phosphomethylpyrimidine kinase
MVSTSGAQLLPANAVHQLRERLLPTATILTPNVPEAMLILSDAGKPFGEPKSVDDLISLAKAVQSLGPKYVLVKGGHLPFKKDDTIATSDEEKEIMIDILYGEGSVTRIETIYQKSKNTHGTGCSLACEFSCQFMMHYSYVVAAIASNLANGLEMVQSVKQACRYVEAGIRMATDIGHGNGPINHFHSTYTLPFPQYVTSRHF